MTWLKLSLGMLSALYGLFAILRFPLVLPVVIVSYLTTVYVLGHSPRINVGTISIYGWDILFLMAIASIPYRLIIQRQVIEPSARFAIFFLILYVAYLEFSEFYYFLFSGSKSLENFIRLSIKGCYPLVALSMYLDLTRAKSNHFWKFVLFCVAIMGVAAAIRTVTGQGFVTSSGTLRYIRIEAMLIMFFPLVVGLFAPNLSRIWRAGLIGLGLGIVVLSSARSAFLGCIAIFGVYGIYLIKTKQLGKVIASNAAIALLVGAFGIVTLVISKPDIAENFFNRAQDTFDTENRTSSDRLNKWTIALETAQENPFGGTKLNLLPDYYGKRELEAFAGALDLMSAQSRLFSMGEADSAPPHNIFVNMLSRNGLIAFILFSAILVNVARHVGQHADIHGKFLIAGWFAGNMVLMQFNNHTNYDASLSLFISIFVFPLIYAVSHHSLELKKESKSASVEISHVQSGQSLHPRI